jgi:hypothetical protein
VRPPVDRDRVDVARRVEAAAAQNPRQLIADFRSKVAERRRQQIDVPARC